MLGLNLRRFREKSLRHVGMVENFWISTNRGLAMAEKKKKKKKRLYDFPVHDCSQEQHGSPYFLPSLDDADVRRCEEGFLEIQMYHTNVTATLVT